MTDSNEPRKDGSSWAVLSYPGFRSMFIAQFIAQAGSAIQVAAVDWHIWSLTHDKFALGLVGLVRVVPIIVLSLFGGVISDAIDRRRLLLVTQTLILLLAGLLALAVLTHQESLPLIYLVTAGIAGLVAFDSPARYALLAHMVPQERVGDAGRLNVVLFTFTGVLGPVLSSLIYEHAGPGATYAANALALVPSIVVLLGLAVPPIPPETKREISLSALREGVRFVFHNQPLWSSMILDFVATFFASALALLPVYADEILKVGLIGYGVLRAAPLVGASLGAILMAQLGNRVKRQGEVMLMAVAVYGLATVIFGASQSFLLCLLALAVIGFSDSVSAAIRNALRQSVTPGYLRGRMQSVAMIFFQGGPQLGEFEAGTLAQATSTSFSVISGGIATILAVGLMAFFMPALRKYRERPQAQTDEIADTELLAEELTSTAV